MGETVTEEEIEALCDKMYQYALGQCRNKQEEAAVKKISKKNLLSWGLLQMQDGKVVPTNGYMLLAQNDNLDAAIQCGVFKGTNRAVFLDRKEYDGPIYEQVDEAYQFVLRNIRMGAEFNGIQRRDVYELPIDSIRELIANAVVHRSYLEPAKVQVALYDDRLEITSPGMLIGGFSIEDLKSGCCQARNRGIVSAFTYMKIIEQWGSGIPRLLENCKSAGLREPELLEIGGSFRVNMFRNTELASNNSGEVREKDGINEDIRDKFVISSDIRDKFGESAAKIAGLMCEKPESTLDEIAEAIGVTRRTVEKQVKKLKEAGIVVRVGSNKSGVWKVTESGK